jgi:HNH endonuclease.
VEKVLIAFVPRDKDIFEKEFEAKHKTSSSKSVWKLRLNVIKGYGGRCELCGESNPHSLTIDHIDGGGSKERKILGGWTSLYRKLRDNNYPRDNYRLLCYNCNCALGFNRITEDELIKLYKQIPEKRRLNEQLL